MLKAMSIQAVVVLMTMCLAGIPCFGQDQDFSSSVYVTEILCRKMENGTRIRVQIQQEPGQGSKGEEMGAQAITGTVQSCDDGVLVFQPEKSKLDLMHVSLDKVLLLEVSQGRSSHALPGALLGMALGFGVSVGTQTHRHQEEFLGGIKDAEENIGRGILITAGTTLLGAAIGSAIGSEKWKSVSGMNWRTSSGSGQLGEYQVSVGYSF